MTAPCIVNRRRTRFFVAWAVRVVSLAGVCAGCAGGPGEPVGSAADWIASARQANEHADAALARGNAQAAEAAVRQALDEPVPREVETEDARVLRQDLWFRLAEIETSVGAPRDALAASESGLALGRADDVFTANLLIARGRALEALNRDEEAAGSYYDAVAIDDKLLSVLLEPDAGAP